MFQKMRFFLEFCRERIRGTSHNFRTKQRILTAPNVVTLGGVLCVLFYAYQYITGTALWLIPITNALVILSDCIDGWLADKLDQHSFLGRIIDPARDRLHSLTILGNVVFLAGSDALLPIVGIISAELGIFLISASQYLVTGTHGAVHALGKARALAHWSVGMVILVGTYWMGYSLPLVALCYVMAAASFVALFAYWLRFCDIQESDFIEE